MKQQLSSQKETNQIKPKEKIHPRKNIAFKCNFCDGGKTSNNIGFKGICSDEVIRHNVKRAKYLSCSYIDSPCRKYSDGTIKSYAEFKKMVEKDYNNYICYESVMLRDWKASAGIVQTGKRKGSPMRLMKVQTNSLAILTTRLPDKKEENRFIFATFLVDDAYEGDTRDEGYVSTNSKYKIKMTLDEAQKLKFWNYYFCANAPDVIKFGSGLHRYLTDVQAAQILRDVVKIKKGTENEILAQEFYENFCTINDIDIMSIPQNNGALMR